MSRRPPITDPAGFIADRTTRTDDGCWIWQRYTTKQGYARVDVPGGGKVYAHRWSYEFFVGPIPAGLQIDHLCRRPSCVNPAHLEVVTQQENYLRGRCPSLINATKTHCDQGHLFDEANTYQHPLGWRRCRECHRARNRRYREQVAS